MMKFKENEDAVSPVIGVILMVAITVILAAVIAAFVFGMGSNVQTQKTVGLSLQKDNTDLKVTILGGPDLATLKYLIVKIDGNTYYTKKDSTTIDSISVDDAGGKFEVGAVFTTTGDAKKMVPGDYKHVIVVGHFSDGQDQMLADKQL